MKVELNWIEGPPTKAGLCLLAIRGSEHAIPASVGSETGLIWSITNPAVKYAPDTIAYRADWPTFPRERDERWVECDRRTWEMMRGDVREVHKQIFAAGQDEYIAEKYLNGKPIGRMEVNVHGHLGARYFRWPTLRERFDPQETPDEYLDRLVKEAAPAWEGVDPDKFMDEVRGRSAGWVDGYKAAIKFAIVRLQELEGAYIEDMEVIIEDNGKTTEGSNEIDRCVAALIKAMSDIKNSIATEPQSDE